jgi:OmpA-OmpF porin, OOP family
MAALRRSVHFFEGRGITMKGSGVPMRLTTIALAALLLAAATAPALAGDGFYVGLGAGWDGQNDNTLNELRPPLSNGQISTNDGAIVAGTLGFKLPMIPIRLEFESGYDWHSVSTFSGFNGVSGSASGHSNIASELFNAIYDLPVGPGWNIYAGFGIGPGNLYFSPVSATGAQLAYVDHWALMWQAIGGVSFEIAPDTDLFVDYRYRDAHARDIIYTPTYGPVLSGITTENVVMAGVRFYLFPMPPPPEAPPPAPYYNEAPPPPPPPPENIPPPESGATSGGATSGGAGTQP